jgi:tRNA-2-methylthio-N6-dimethylallyladenosine synthase
MLIGSADNTRLVQFIGDKSLIGQFATIRVSEIRSMNLVQGELVSG